MLKRLTEIFFVLTVIAVVMRWQSTTSEPPITEEAKPRAAVPAPIAVGDAVPDFDLVNAQGEMVSYRKGDGPYFVTLTATGCGDCIARVGKADTVAYEMAKKSGFEVWNMLVYHPQDRAAQFVEQHNPVADQVLADPKSQVSVRTLGGSDSTCWLLINGKGELAYRGPANLEKLEGFLATL